MEKEFEKETSEKIPEKREYIPPKIETIWIELEQGITNSSTYISTIEGDIKTQWEGEEEQEVDVNF
ncbi:hypothetical protein HZP56_14285 [Elizabethkingia anophelis]|uniref:Uncharacterized protein n=1 Tax=Elizabethkingia anophelis TaxID=1117645 RepID=A0AAE4T2Q1_9FLAO|nr:hypothetical protein [Elizabethkingia anophelis]MCT3763934.1 hypothetical protein [Elizabethkingia anophelis]MCT3803351.1 hypothetical protein [Elizabethkingia anophelis]MCT3835566.1 hypothetical protein [Elizabethkingia anophelis]MCT3920570.1 hypothetical protein [Elizabethkingia anophelis]MCT3925125.1 hypothetical protein [Elizabethkingia anophelis]